LPLKGWGPVGSDGWNPSHGIPRPAVCPPADVLGTAIPQSFLSRPRGHSHHCPLAVASEFWTALFGQDKPSLSHLQRRNQGCGRHFSCS
jgi:hypothetical protein